MQEKLIEQLLNDESVRDEQSLKQLVTNVDDQVLAFWQV